MSKDTWSKKEGLDLRRDKTKILKKELREKGRKSKEVPKVKDPQVHKGKEKYIRNNTSDDKHIHLEKFKEGTMRKLTSLYDIVDLETRCKKKRKIEGRLYHVLSNGGSFTEEEANKIVDAYMICREKSDPNHHPLQSSVVCSNQYKSRATILNLRIFSHSSIKRALNKRGFHLNIGPFSAAESLILMKNFEKFLTRHGRATDKDSIWKTLTEDFRSFYGRTRMFLYIGKGLNRNSSQVRYRLFSLYHPYDGKSDAKTDAYILSRVPKLESVGLHRKHKKIGEEIGRFRNYVKFRYHYLTNDASFFNKSRLQDVLKLITKQQNCAIKDIAATNVNFATIAAQLGVKEEILRSFWKKEGERICVRAALPKWKLADSLTMLKAIEDEDEEDENCIDFKGIYDRAFRGKVQNWEHLREHYNRVRRVVPYYMLNDLQSTVAAAIKAIKEKMEKAAGVKQEEEDVENELEEDEDTFIE